MFPGIQRAPRSVPKGEAMQYTRLGNTGLVVSRFAFGAMTFGTGDVPAVYKVGEDEARAMVDVGIQERNGWARFVAAQMYYSLVGRDVEHEVLPFVQDAGIGTMIWSPLAGGFLSGKYTRESLKDEGNRLSGFDFLPIDKEQGFALVDAMRTVAASHHATVARVALGWLLAKPGVSTIVLGASKRGQLEDNLGAMDVRLDPEEVRRLDELSPHAPYYPSWFTERLADATVARALQP
jgi:aryl-alcohol dehydrogenase-like predicted oxidoreductase